jgi:hypothetical protein
MQNLLDEAPTRNTEAPKWLILHRPPPIERQRRSWGQDMAFVVDALINSGEWVMWREGHEVHVKHRAFMTF